MRRDQGQPTPNATPPRGTSTLPAGGAVFIDPRVDPAASGYVAGVMARRGGLPKQDMPLSPERPPMPTLSGRPPEGAAPMTMAEYGRAERAAMPAMAAAVGPSIIEEGPAAPAAVAPERASRPTVSSLGLGPNDLLTEQAHADPAFRQGPGSQFAANQPELAAKYGVMRGSQFIPPQRLGRQREPGASTLRPETLADLERLQQLRQQPSAPGLDESDLEARKTVTEGIGGSAARVGGVSTGDPIKPRGETAEDRQKVLKDAIEQMDAFEFNQWRQLTMRQILHSEEERELIESRLKPLDLYEMLQNNVIRQRIPIIPGKYELTLQSYEGQAELALKRLVMMEARSVDVGEQYLLDKHSFMGIAVGLYKINDKVYPEIIDKDGVFNDEMFFKKFNMVMRLPLHMLSSIGVNLMWFEMRVRKLYSATAVGNG